MSEDDHLIIIKDSNQQPKFTGNFDLEFINIMRKEQCYRRTCKVNIKKEVN